MASINSSNKQHWRKIRVLRGSALPSIALLLMAAFPAQAADLPAGGQITAGSGTIATAGDTMTVTQDTAKMAADWQSFSIGKNHAVNFVQPSADALALNRVLGSEVSVIQGALNANGRIFLINPNGVTFTPDAQVNAGALVASTLNLSTEDFMAGRYTFAGDSAAEIRNSGSLNAPGGTVALIAAKIVNEGVITADEGNVLMGAGSKVTLDLGGPVKLEIEDGALQTQIDQGGAIRADGGTVYMTAKAAGELATSVINHTGITEARTLATGRNGKIILMGDMESGHANIAGALNASAPAAGDGGFIETSAAHVDIAAGTRITAGAANGKGGEWLIDPFDYVIDSTAADNIAAALDTGTDVTVETSVDTASYGSTGSGANGNIKVQSGIQKTAGGDAVLTLRAQNVIDLAAEITSTAGKLGLTLEADSDHNGGGVIIATKGVSLNGGELNFGTGVTATIGGQSVLVGGDVYVGGTDQVVFKTGGGNINLYGELIIANEEGVKFISDNGDVHFRGIINSGNQYEKVSAGGANGSGPFFTWLDALNGAKNGTTGGDAVGESYLATVTSRLENAVVVYTGDFLPGIGNNIVDLSNGAWLGGQRVLNEWRWVAGPEGLADSGQGLLFYQNNTGVGAFTNWRAGEPNGGTGGGGEDKLQIGDQTGGWNDLSNNDGSVHIHTYIRETNFDTANLEIDAGTGTVTFDEDIGGLKGINYTAYDASNPKPVPQPPPPDPAPAPVPAPSPPAPAANTPTPPQINAVASAQSGASSQTAQAFYTPMSAPTLSAPAPGTDRGMEGVGSLEIVQVSSRDGGNDDAEGNPVTPGDQAGIQGPTKVFVVDGGIRLPDGARDDESGE